MIFLLSPAKSITESPETPQLPLSEPAFIDQAEYLMQKLKQKSARQLSKLMNISPDLAGLNVLRNAEWSKSILVDSGLAAAALFDGDVYKGWEFSTLSKDAQQYAQKHTRILSGLYGLLRPLDKMLPYRLEMGCPFQVTPAKNNLYKYWGKTLANALNAETDVVVNLASNEYFKAVGAKSIQGRLIQVDFREEKEGVFKMVGFFAKRARGMMMKYACENQVQSVEELKKFNLGGYIFNDILSKEGQWVFTRPYPVV